VAMDTCVTRISATALTRDTISGSRTDKLFVWIANEVSRLLRTLFREISPMVVKGVNPYRNEKGESIEKKNIG